MKMNVFRYPAFLGISLFFLLTSSTLFSGCLGSSEDDTSPTPGDLDQTQGDRDYHWPTDGDTDSDPTTDGDIPTDGDIDDLDSDTESDLSEKPDTDIDGDEDLDSENDIDNDVIADSEGPAPSIVLPAQIIFDPVILNQTDTENLLIQNHGDAALEIRAVNFHHSCQDEFSVVTPPQEFAAIGPGESRVIILSYRMLDAGEDSCTLYILSNDPLIPEASVQTRSTYSGSPLLSISTATLNFGDWDILNPAGKSLSVTLTHVAQPDSNAVLELGPFTFESSSPQFYYDDTFVADQTQMLAPGDSIDIPVVFKPDSVGNISDRMLFTTNAESDTRATGAVDLSGRGVAPSIELTPESMDFGRRPLGSLTQLALVLTNSGGGEAIIESAEIVEGSTPFSFDASAALDQPFGASQSQTIHVSYVPTSLSTHNTTLRLTGRFYPSSTLDVALSGEGITPSWELSRQSVSFGQTGVYTTAEETVSIANVGETALDITSFSLSGDAAFSVALAPGEQLPATIAVDDTLDLTLTFTPLERAAYSGKLTINADDPDTPSLDVLMDGQGVAPTLSLTDPEGAPLADSLYFEQVRIGEQVDLAFVAQNLGEVELLLNPISLLPSGQLDFRISPNPADPIQPEAETLFTLTYQPKLPPGADAATLLLESNDPERPETRIGLSGYAINPLIAVTPATAENSPWDFGRLQVYQTFGPREFVITNSGFGPLTIERLDIEIDNGTGSEFSISGASASLPFDITPGTEGHESFTFGVSFLPLAVTTYTCRVNIHSSDLDNPVTTVYLAGSGRNCEECWHDIDDDPSDCEYYCCYSNGGVEVCDTEDNNCDGQTDEQFDLGTACEGLGECGQGHIECHPENPQFTVCSTDRMGSVYEGVDEICDAKDNDCDGQTDEGFDIGQSCDGIGQCGLGLIECKNANESVCSTDIDGSEYSGGTEYCNGLDDDCDTQTDEGFDVDTLCDGVGECGEGVIECDPQDENLTLCSTDIGGSSHIPNGELCNNLDDDCDGQTDEELELGNPCQPPGECGEGVIECDGLYLTRCSTAFGGSAYDGSAEICDGKDNDCDDSTDEGFNLDEACDGAGECGAGVTQCDPNNPIGVICSTEPGGTSDESAPEVCDGKDNNCNNQVDEAFSLGVLCDGTGECGIGVVECDPDNDNRTICSSEPGGSDDQSKEELCNNLDDDCDGLTDGGLGVGEACQPPGECRAGVVECDAQNIVQCSTGPGGSSYDGSAEICDNHDNDCDGQTDEDFSLGSACNGEGECGEGLVECHPTNANQTVCSTDALGSNPQDVTEICDDKDNDCNGQTDEGFSVGVICEGIGVCGEGLTECDASNPTRTLCSTDIGGSQHQHADELCNAFDDDCDGQTDEDFPTLGDLCTYGVGDCNVGVIECMQSDATQTICSKAPGGSQYNNSEEVCNGVDDNCDGATDEGFNIGASCSGIGACGDGILECNGLHATRCSTLPGGSADQSTTEICDEVDNDCDDQTDEGFSIGTSCDGIGECGQGQLQCAPDDSSATICSTDMGGRDDQSSTDVCDGLDNDCDGFSDEDFNIGLPCNGIGVCGSGITECHPTDTNRAICSTDVDGSQDQSVSELCNGFDDDCDSQTDEDFPLGDSCEGEGYCGSGALECDPADANSIICSTEPGGSENQAKLEWCDDIDNDCDSQTDEDYNIGSACEGVGECPQGQLECFSFSRAICSTNPGGSAYVPVSELCDNKDNDCDGSTDENFSLGLPCNGVGICGEGVRECHPTDPSSWICSTDIGGSSDGSETEICNEQDDDCDGLIDEDFGVGAACLGIGECANGVLECAGPDNTRCSSNPGGSEYTNVTELCDGLDNDCDGLTDEDFLVGQSCDGIGQCGSGLIECADTTHARCSTDIGGSQYDNPLVGGKPELCDGKDNDCDGQKDEDFDIGQSCSGVGECPNGVWECDLDDSSVRLCSTNFNGSAYSGSDEQCDSLDNDCDGQTDEDYNIGGLCDGEGPCGLGVWVCLNALEVTCSSSLVGHDDYEGVNETCNDIDDDCDAQTDEDFFVGAICDGEGECGQGMIECRPGDPLSTICSTDPEGSHREDIPESCDDLDNDCDGQTDEDFFIGDTCDGTGECGIGQFECASLISNRCSTDPGGSADDSGTESCNGLDDDCDGVADEDYALGQLCNGIGACGEGVYECNVSGSVRCSTDVGGTEYDGSSELCNGIDDDCDTETDEDFDLGESCSGIGECADDPGEWECGGNQEAVCSTSSGGSEYAGEPEACDSLDNDCDGRIDEDFGIGELCDGVGQCGIGTWECKTESTRACSTEPFQSEDQSITERCNLLDDDCDGYTDETFPVGSTCLGIGACPTGVYECNPEDDSSYICSTNPGGSAYDEQVELCNGLDDDCDTQVDEDYQIGYGCNGTGVCLLAFGSWLCNGPDERVCSVDLPYVLSTCDPYYNPGDCVSCDPAQDPENCIANPDFGGQAELCDQLDNDCDGETDEDFPNLGDTCDAGGACGIGFVECNTDDPSQTRCSKDPGGSQYGTNQEVCNGLDDDCDSETDEDFDIGNSCTGQGECDSGVYECATLTARRCSVDIGGSEYAGVDELCDGLDNDCDGVTDEGYQLGTSCNGVGECGPGVKECDPQNALTTICSTDIDGSQSEDLPESCNSQDDDCDGLTDEDFDLGQSCDGLGECGQGVNECNGIGGVRCSSEWGGSQYEGVSESCNLSDDDCDGLIDEGFGIFDVYGERILCTGSGGCGQGLMECLDATTPICSTDPGGSQFNPTGERCNGLDDDCDTQTDEDWPTLSQACDGVGACGIGVYECNLDEDGIVCSTDSGGSEFGGRTEFCNGVDDDCDSQTDEDFAIGQVCEGEGECGQGVTECANDTSIRCDVDLGGSHYGGSTELCDNLDNNCDGRTDEGFQLGDTCDGIGECRLGIIECDANDPTRSICSTNPGGSAFDGITERCDQKDNDCDGETDESFPIGEPCTAPGPCGGGVLECDTPSSVRCSTQFGGSNWTGSPESCNGQDDDCDYLTDEDFFLDEGTTSIPLGEACDGPGECGMGIVECDTPALAICSTAPGGSAYLGMSELCDGKDNDCDGLTDETFDLGDPCTGIGSCGAGITECTSAQSGIQCSSNPGGTHDNSQIELCDGNDNDCDTLIDEDFEIGESCQGQGQCGSGVWECLNADTRICSTSLGGSQYTPESELCDGIDNDCDGQTDEDFLVGQSCDGIGECGAGVYECINTVNSLCSTNPGGSQYIPHEELCNNLDDNCNGQTDEGMQVGEACSSPGECGSGIIECAPDGTSRCSSGPEGSGDGSQLEICDGLDNDCDTETDEGFNIGQVCNTSSACGQGVYECDESGSSRCSTDFGGSQHQGATELCDGLDNNCDGETDEGYNLDTICEGIGLCGAGNIECVPGTNQTRCSTDIEGSDYAGSFELCDHLDNDCDGQTDEDYLVGQSCEGIGECGIGVYECKNETAFRCSTDIAGSEYEGVNEICDGRDNDCDGKIDETFLLNSQTWQPISCLGTGKCGYGILECDGEHDVRCSTDPSGSQYSGSPEKCNHIDDDCDGATDEDFGVGQPCEGVGECGLGALECLDENQAVCSTDINGGFYGGSTELCDGLDNDCDGQSDEDFGVGLECNGVGECGTGVIECHPSNQNLAICSSDPDGSQTAQSPEICDSLDNDCDGQTDEDWPDLGNPCVGTGGCSDHYGIYECADAGSLICSTSFGGSQYNPSGSEICDGMDNDCDGQTDEDFPLGTACPGVGQCESGVLECDDQGSTRCSTMPGGSANMSTMELCDGIDNDCDGQTDENYNIGQSCQPQGECGPGVLECLNVFTSICSTSPNGSQSEAEPELCDDLDNNCDGRTDEIYNIGQSCDGLGECGAGFIECDTPITTRCSSDANGSSPDTSPEICDAKDNDCDGSFDENFNVGAVCTGIGGCGQGVIECFGAHNTICSSMPGGSNSQAVPELCDGVDNDCNGLTDETFGVGSACQPSQGCNAGVYECGSLYDVICSTEFGGSAYTGSPEKCDGVDNDCDGLIDEDYRSLDPSDPNEEWPYCNGLNCGGLLNTFCQGVGECGTGVWECDDTEERTRCSTIAYEDDRGTGSQYNPVTETCNNKDDNCNGQTDEDFSIGSSCNGVGECPNGVLECATLSTTRCSTLYGGSAYAGRPERCDGLDNDCDYQTDEGYSLTEFCVGDGECGIGQWECFGLYSAICSTNPGGSDYDDPEVGGKQELCDEKDNDCDGQTDELWPEKNQPCSPGLCGTGEWVCREDYQGIECTAWQNAEDEVCDGLDNNCDGITDEGFDLGVGCIGEGLCGPGRTECDPNDPARLATICSTDFSGTAYQGTDEVCNYLDDDCDGQTDEDFKDAQGNYNWSVHCGACNQSCEYSNAQGTCVDGECQVGACLDGYFDLNEDSSDGCECEATALPDSPTCNEADLLPGGSNLSDELPGMVLSESIQLLNTADEAWLMFYANDTLDVSCDNFSLHVWLSDNPGNLFRFDIYRGGCQGSQLACSDTVEFNDYYNFSDPTVGPGTSGECPCRPEEWMPTFAPSYESNWPYRFCTDESATYYVRVYYDPSATDPICDAVVINASNGL